MNATVWVYIYVPGGGSLPESRTALLQGVNE